MLTECVLLGGGGGDSGPLPVPRTNNVLRSGIPVVIIGSSQRDNSMKRLLQAGMNDFFKAGFILMIHFSR